MKKILSKTILKTLAIIALVGGAIYFLYRYFGFASSRPLPGNSIFSLGSSDWKEGDWVRVKFWKKEPINKSVNVPKGSDIVVGMPAPVEMTEISGNISVDENGLVSITVKDARGVGKGDTYYFRKEIVKSIKKETEPIEG